MAARRDVSQLAFAEAETEQPLDWGESWARRRGWQRIVGVDEVGRGPLAGPVVAAAVLLPPELERELVAEGLDDSKKIKAHLREALSSRIRSRAHVGVGIVDAARIDRVNILRASLEAMHAAVTELARGLEAPPDVLLVDGRDPIAPSPLPAVPQRPLVKGDGRAVCVAAASVVAKVRRDALMVEADAAHPGYGFAAHKGYGCREHLEALAELGPSPIHRRSFRGVGGPFPDDGDDRQLTL